MLQPIFFYALKAWSKTRMLHKARTVHIRPLRARATMLSHQPPTSPLPLPVEERKGVGGKVRAALTPGPSPALRERGDLVYERGIVERRRRRIAAALLISPLPLPVEERQGLGGKVRAALTPGPSPALRERGDLVYERGIVERRRRRIAAALLISPPASPRVGAEGGWGEGEGPPFLKQFWRCHTQVLDRALS